MTTDEYRELFQLDVTTSTACTDTSELKRASMLEQIADAGPGRVYPPTERDAPPTIPRWRSLAVRRPDLMVDWDTDTPDNPDPYTIGEHSRGKVGWRCHSCGHRWRQSPKVRSHGRGCPACGRRRIIEATVQRNQQPPPRERSLGVLRPDLLTEWHPTRNQGIDRSRSPADLSARSGGAAPPARPPSTTAPAPRRTGAPPARWPGAPPG